MVHVEIPADDSSKTGFEGSEKKLELDFVPIDSNFPADMRNVSKEGPGGWDEICALARCTIISSTKNEHFDSFVLSESSLFVYPNKVMIKTCGTTSLLHCLELLISTAASVNCKPDFVQFSRTNLLWPEKQHFPHRSFATEVDYLNQLFPEGRAYVMGPESGPRWHLYIADLRPDNNQRLDQTLEVMMFDLDPRAMSNFFQKDDPNVVYDSKACTQATCIDQLIPGSVIDDFLFSPCGYSCNGLRDDVYFTIHVTPEAHCSYVSFETNLKLASYQSLIQAVFNIFRPGLANVSLFVDEKADLPDALQGSLDWHVDGFRMTDHTHNLFEGGYSAACAKFLSNERDEAAIRFPVEPLANIAAQHFAPKCPTTLGSFSPRDDDTSSQTDSTTLSDVIDEIEKAKMEHAMPISNKTPVFKPFSVFSPFADQIPEQINIIAMPAFDLSEEVAPQLIDLDIIKEVGKSAVAVDPIAALDGPMSYKEVQQLSFHELMARAMHAVNKHTDVRDFSASEERVALESLLPEVVSTRLTEEAFFVADVTELVTRFQRWCAAFPDVEPVCSVQCNNDLGVLAALNSFGCGFQVSCEDELRRALDVGADPSRIIHMNPFRSKAEIKTCTNNGVTLLTFDNLHELRKLAMDYPKADLVMHLAVDYKAVAPKPRFTALEVEETFLQTACKTYGASIKEVPALLAQAQKLGANVVGCSFQIPSSSVRSLEEYRQAVACAKQAFDMAAALGMNWSVLGLGGGWPSEALEADPEVPSFDMVAADVNRLVSDTFPNVRVFAEPSRNIVTSAMTLVCNVIARREVRKEGTAGSLLADTRQTPDFLVYINDGLYGAFTNIVYESAKPVPQLLSLPEAPARDMAPRPCTLFGPTCDGIDCLAQLESRLPELQLGDYVFFRNMGAYTISASTNFNGFARSRAIYVRS